jgi:SAM-dependent methyltransferase
VAAQRDISPQRSPERRNEGQHGVLCQLADLVAGGAALEFGLGTGRVALPLAHRGVRVHGIELSRAMIARFREKPGGNEIGVTIGDFASTTVEGRFSLAYLVANTIMNLTTQDEQVACFANAAAHLEPGGSFLIEVLVPGLQRLPPGETFQPLHVGRQRASMPASPRLRRAWCCRS